MTGLLTSNIEPDVKQVILLPIPKLTNHVKGLYIDNRKWNLKLAPSIDDLTKNLNATLLRTEYKAEEISSIRPNTSWNQLQLLMYTWWFIRKGNNEAVVWPKVSLGWACVSTYCKKNYITICRLALVRYSLFAIPSHFKLRNGRFENLTPRRVRKTKSLTAVEWIFEWIQRFIKMPAEHHPLNLFD